MRLAVISDVHGNLAALQAVLEDIESQQVDQVVNLGDLLSGPLQPAETAQLLMTRGMVTIAGNHERQLLEIHARDGAPTDPATSDGYAAACLTAQHWAWLGSLPPVHQLAPDVLLVHGTPESDLVYWLETVVPGTGQNGVGGLRTASPDEVRERAGSGAAVASASLVLCGHSHVPRAVQSGTTLIVNPGSVGLQAYHAGYSHPHCMENGAPHARYALVERRGARWHARLCAVGYDWAAPSRLAQERGRPEWACALATGRLPPATIRA